MTRGLLIRSNSLFLFNDHWQYTVKILVWVSWNNAGTLHLHNLNMLPF